MILQCKDLYASYKNRKDFSPVLSSVSVKIEQGKLVCLTGANGSGKSSLLNILSGLAGKKTDSLQITSAEQLPQIVEEFGNQEIIEIQKMNRLETAKKIGFMSQSEYSAWNTSVLDTILTGRFAHSGTAYTRKDYELAEEASSLLNISNLLSRSTFSLSGGEYQKVRIARTIAQNPAFILLDEPCAGLDFSYEPELLKKLKKLAETKNTGIMLSIHDLNTAARFADEIILLSKNAPSIQGSVESVFTEKNLSEAYKSDFKIFKHPVLNCPQVFAQ